MAVNINTDGDVSSTFRYNTAYDDDGNPKEDIDALGNWEKAINYSSKATIGDYRKDSEGITVAQGNVTKTSAYKYAGGVENREPVSYDDSKAEERKSEYTETLVIGDPNNPVAKRDSTTDDGITS